MGDAEMPKLTKKIVDRLELPAKGQKFVWDAELKGFGIRLTPGGKSYLVQARVGGATRRTTIGKHGVFTAKQARDEAEDKLREMSKGVDPVQKKKAEKLSGITLNEVAESYIRDRTLKPNSIRDIHKHMKGVFKDWQKKPITKITRDDCLTLFRKRSTESPSQANQSFRVLRALLNYAIEVYRPVITENPVQVLSGAGIWNTIKPKNRKIPIAEVGRAWCKLEEIKADPTLEIAGHSMVDAVMFCLFTGCRWGEAQKLTWGNVDLENKSWFIEDPKNKNDVTLPLSTQAVDLLENRFRIENNPFVFCSEKSRTGYIGPGRYITDQLAATLEIELSPHDLRRTFRAIAAELDVELWRTKLLMNHKINNDVTIQAYTEKQDLEYLRPSIQAIGTWIERKAKEHRAKVVDINSKRKAV
jgi:integrase